MNTTKILWNGCDGYLTVDSATARFGGFDLEDAFEVVEIDKASIATDEDGEMIRDVIYVTEDMRCFRQV